jgi:maltose alpha-D-glucosyltransferase/alpha-amylase
MDALWFKNAVIYSMDVATFQDSNDDGIGDLRGVTRRLDYLRGLGVTCLWLLPFFPSPDRDNGYDVSDYYGVDPRHGDLGEFTARLEAADELGIKVLIDLVLQHTSDQHPWFREACSSRDSPFRDFYIWTDDPEQEPPVDPMFPDWQEGTWTWSEEAGQHHRHHFYGFEPDLNIINPAVRWEIAKIVRFWLRLGASGFRVDVAAHLVTQAGRAVRTTTGTGTSRSCAATSTPLIPKRSCSPRPTSPRRSTAPTSAPASRCTCSSTST